MLSTHRQWLYLGLSTILVAVCSAFRPAAGTKSMPTKLMASATSSDDRREFVKQASVLAGALLVGPASAQAGLLDEFGSDPSKIQVAEKPREVIASARQAGEAVQIDPTLRASYYYPTAKKRYLPRIQKVTALISEVPQAIANGDWAAVEEFAATCDNAVLPLQLYVSSLDGQGLSMANSYAKAMKNDAKIFESNFKDLQKALKKKDKELALKSVQEMGVAVADYRQAGRLTDSDGNIPSVEEIRRSTMRRSTQAGFALAQQ